MREKRHFFFIGYEVIEIDDNKWKYRIMVDGKEADVVSGTLTKDAV